MPFQYQEYSSGYLLFWWSLEMPISYAISLPVVYQLSPVVVLRVLILLPSLPRFFLSKTALIASSFALLANKEKRNQLLETYFHRPKTPKIRSNLNLKTRTKIECKQNLHSSASFKALSTYHQMPPLQDPEAQRLSWRRTVVV